MIKTLKAAKKPKKSKSQKKSHRKSKSSIGKRKRSPSKSKSKKKSGSKISLLKKSANNKMSALLRKSASSKSGSKPKSYKLPPSKENINSSIKTKRSNSKSFKPPLRLTTKKSSKSSKKSKKKSSRSRSSRSKSRSGSSAPRVQLVEMPDDSADRILHVRSGGTVDVVTVNGNNSASGSGSGPQIIRLDGGSKSGGSGTSVMVVGADGSAAGSKSGSNVSGNKSNSAADNGGGLFGGIFGGGGSGSKSGSKAGSTSGSKSSTSGSSVSAASSGKTSSSSVSKPSSTSKSSGSSVSASSSSGSASSSSTSSLGIDKKTLAVLDRKGYRILKKLAQGSYGQVYKGERKQNGRPVAIKAMNLARLSGSFRERCVPLEMKALIDSHHPNIVKIYDIIRSNQTLFIFMEFCPNGDMGTLVRTTGPMPECRARYWFRQIADAVYYLHRELHMAHRDIKLDNVLLDANYDARLTDFGFATKCWDETKHKVIMSQTTCGTKPYMSPQLVNCEPYNAFSADVWALGVMLFAMLEGRFPFSFLAQPSTVLDEQFNASISFDNSQFGNQPIDLIGGMLRPKESNRMSMAEVVNHPWVKMCPSASGSLGLSGTGSDSNSSRISSSNNSSRTRSNTRSISKTNT